MISARRAAERSFPQRAKYGSRSDWTRTLFNGSEPKSKRLAEFLEALSDERLTREDKLNILLNVWKSRRRRGDSG